MKLFIITLLLTIISVWSSTNAPLLWKATKGPQQVYLFGSIHVADDSFYPMVDYVTEAWNKAEVLVVEVDMESIKPMDAQALMLRYAQYPAGNTLKNSLSPDNYTILKKYVVDSIGLQMQMFEPFKPWYVCQVVMMAMMQKMGFASDMGIDMHFLSNRGNRKVLPLESMEFQIELFDNIGSDSSFIDYTLKSSGNALSLVNQLMTSWKSGDSLELSNFLFMDANVPAYKKMYDLLFYGRNDSMTQNIIKVAETKKVGFVVVGAGHLLGDRGIVEQLKKAGYSISRVRASQSKKRIP
ncbi:MAG: TraB/GumN family protein [Fibrobacterales bacterium]